MAESFSNDLECLVHQSEALLEGIEFLPGDGYMPYISFFRALLVQMRHKPEPRSRNGKYVIKLEARNKWFSHNNLITPDNLLDYANQQAALGLVRKVSLDKIFFLGSTANLSEYQPATLINERVVPIEKEQPVFDLNIESAAADKNQVLGRYVYSKGQFVAVIHHLADIEPISQALLYVNAMKALI